MDVNNAIIQLNDSRMHVPYRVCNNNLRGTYSDVGIDSLFLVATEACQGGKFTALNRGVMVVPGDDGREDICSGICHNGDIQRPAFYHTLCRKEEADAV